MRATLLAFAISSLLGIATALPVDGPSPTPNVSPIQVHLESVTADEPTVKVVIKNSGKSTLNLFTESDLLTKADINKLDITKDQKTVEFHGLRVRFDYGDLGPEDFEAVPSGKSIERVIDIAKSYDLTAGGDFEITAKGFLARSATKEDGSDDFGEFGVPIFYSSNTLKMHVNGTSAAHVKRGVHEHHKRMQLHNDCNGQQWQVVKRAMSNCAQIASRGAQAAQQGDATFQAFFKTTDGRVRQNVASRLQAISQECAAQDRGRTRLHCVDDSRDSRGCTNRAIAFTYGLSGPPEIYLCNSFYSSFPATPQRCGVNDQASTILHELAHNTRVFSPGATDIPGGYGSQATLQMDTRTALQNADSYSFFSAYAVLQRCPLPGGYANRGRYYGTPTTGTRQPQPRPGSNNGGARDPYRRPYYPYNNNPYGNTNNGRGTVTGGTYYPAENTNNNNNNRYYWRWWK